jgi:hypothetical protein
MGGGADRRWAAAAAQAVEAKLDRAGLDSLWTKDRLSPCFFPDVGLSPRHESPIIGANSPLFSWFRAQTGRAAAEKQSRRTKTNRDGPS